MSLFNQSRRTDAPAAPCHGCVDRHVGCHGPSCPHGWSDYEVLRDKHRHKIKLAKEHGLYLQRTREEAGDISVKKKQKTDLYKRIHSK